VGLSVYTSVYIDLAILEYHASRACNKIGKLHVINNAGGFESPRSPPDFGFDVNTRNTG
jgi:hypothetical protein